MHTVHVASNAMGDMISSQILSAGLRTGLPDGPQVGEQGV